MTTDNGNGNTPRREYTGDSRELDGIRAAVDERIINSSVIEGMPRPNPNSGPVPSFDSSIFWFVGQFADNMLPWNGRTVKLRDQQLRNFILEEPIFASALGIICSRNSGFSWKLDGPERIVNRYQDVLDNADQGEGWHSLMVKTTIDLGTQDNGAFWELVRMENTNEKSPVIAVNHLDSARCWHTGNKYAPVIYLDRLGRYHLLYWWQVIKFVEMPTAVEGFFGIQYCSLSRILKAVQIRKNDLTLDYESSSGMNARQIHLVKGITSQQLTDAINRSKAQSTSQGLSRFMNPVVVGQIDPTADVGAETIDLAHKSYEGAEVEQNFMHYIAMIAMAFETDYQEFAPLPGSKLGTSGQSEILHLKSRGKGPGQFMGLITHAMNFLILPRNLRFYFDEQDLEAQKGMAEVQAIRAQTRATQINSGEITTETARQMAADDGDLKYEYIALMGEQDVTPNVDVSGDATATVQARNVTGVKPGMPGPSGPPGAATPGIPSGAPERQSQPALIRPKRPPTPMGTKAEEEELEEPVVALREQVREFAIEMSKMLEEARRPKATQKIIHRNKAGLIERIEEIEVG